MDMYDLKPDAPKEFRGEFKPIPTNVPGCQICEHMPLQAKMWDRLAAIRSIVSVDEHSDSLVMTGYSDGQSRTGRHPSFGSVVSKVRSSTADVPPFVSMRGMSRRPAPARRTSSCPALWTWSATTTARVCSKRSTPLAAMSMPPAR
jgi:hypothetical protein